LNTLPLERIIEIHVSGPRWLDESLVDVHDTLLDEDYTILCEVLTRSNPTAITLEYARDRQALIEQLARLRIITG
jgi:uncharacterized protein (UPF0276 family)